ncbi:unnamed protein product [Rotaria sp. Silwood1]|nr:unnamed protein product [Rotaria sp. Silwood1]
MYSTLIQACLMRAALIRSKVSDFHNERCDVQIVFLNNGYSINFIKEHVEQFFQDFHISNWKSNLNQNTYDKMCEEIIECDQQHQAMKIKQRWKQQREQLCYITSDLNEEELYDFQQNITTL